MLPGLAESAESAESAAAVKAVKAVLLGLAEAEAVASAAEAVLLGVVESAVEAAKIHRKKQNTSAAKVKAECRRGNMAERDLYEKRKENPDIRRTD